MATTDILIATLCILAFIQPTRQRLVIALAFALPCAIFSLYSHHLPDVIYYEVAAWLSSLLLVGVCFFAKHDRFASLMIAICSLDVILNLIGLNLYSQSNNGFWYERGFEALYVCAIFLYLTKEKANVNIWDSFFRLPYPEGDRVNSLLHKEAKN